MALVLVPVSWMHTHLHTHQRAHANYVRGLEADRTSMGVITQLCAGSCLLSALCAPMGRRLPEGSPTFGGGEWIWEKGQEKQLFLKL